jgi:hypothetical protein
MPVQHQLRWGRVVLSGVFIELMMLAIIVPLNWIRMPADSRAKPEDFKPNA